MTKACTACGSEDLDLEETPPFCNECGEEVTEEEGGSEASADLVVVAVITESVPVPNKDKLTKLRVDLGGGKEVTVVTNAKYCDAGKRIVVAKVGASLPNMEELVAKATVGGVKSEGMVCDSPMLGWSGGAAGQAVFLPESFSAGEKPPTSRPKPSS
eukprot:GFUD01128485.1.p2 GENE.GFUD01128485.1~~GFUD01128485.1.p2  ORF type:complete len:157 (-),score=53.93 GFUD01128485.1:543-1013(-)